MSKKNMIYQNSVFNSLFKLFIIFVVIIIIPKNTYAQSDQFKGFGQVFIESPHLAFPKFIVTNHGIYQDSKVKSITIRKASNNEVYFKLNFNNKGFIETSQSKDEFGQLFTQYIFEKDKEERIEYLIKDNDTLAKNIVTNKKVDYDTKDTFITITKEINQSYKKGKLITQLRKKYNSQLSSHNLNPDSLYYQSEYAISEVYGAVKATHDEIFKPYLVNHPFYKKNFEELEHELIPIHHDPKYFKANQKYQSQQQRDRSNCTYDYTYNDNGLRQSLQSVCSHQKQTLYQYEYEYYHK